MPSLLLLASMALSTAAPGAPPPDAVAAVIARAKVAAHDPRPAGFSAILADAEPITGPDRWTVINDSRAWAALATAPQGNARGAARWAYARSLIGQGRGQEARGVLEVMLAADPSLALVDNFRLALGAASAEAGNVDAAVAALGQSASSDTLASNPEACAWRLWALTARVMPQQALQQIRCALPALNQRSRRGRAPFLYAGARALLATGRPALVAAWLSTLPEADVAANLYRARAALALGDAAGARARLALARDGSRQQQVESEIIHLEADFAAGRLTTAQIARLDRLALIWRGDALETRVLRLSYQVGTAQHDLRRSLGAGAALIRYCRLGEAAAPLLAELQELLARGLATGSRIPIADAAGLFWEYRDLSPVGAQGDFLASQLADRLASQGLYLRAADLLRHQLIERAHDVAQGPLSAHVASLYILSGRPTAALEAIRATDGNDYPLAMQWERHRMEAVALFQLGRRSEALAALQDVPDGAALRAEIIGKHVTGRL